MPEQNRSTYMSIEAAKRPLVYVADSDLRATGAAGGHLHQRVATRALEGMQKEALLAEADSDVVWRMVCDEGPYLNGTDLAPPPLAYFAAGMAASLGSGICARIAERGEPLRALQITQDNFYSMDGSAVRGTMVAGALPVELSIAADSDLDEAAFRDIVLAAVGNCPIDHLMRTELEDTFSLTLNGAHVATNKVRQSASDPPDDPAKLIAGHAMTDRQHDTVELVSKLESTESVFEEDHGAGAAMKDTQKRQLHLRAILELTGDRLFEVRVQIFKPIGSVFRFVAENASRNGAAPRAPHGLSYVSAGIAFCFMTQLGRYAGIMKTELDSYGIVQDTAFDIDGGRCLPVDTHTFLQMQHSVETGQTIVDMGEQTCFLHGACRLANKTRLRRLTMQGRSSR